MYKDLSVILNPQTPMYPGDPAVEIKPSGDLDTDGFEDHLVTFGTHAGTHIDAPAHMITRGKTLDQYPIERFTGRGVLIRVKDQFNLDDIQAADIKPGDIVLFSTGFEDKYHSPDYFETYPTIPEAVAHYLVEKKVSMVGLDTCGPDHGPFPIHKILLAADILIIENLTGLSGLTGAFNIIALPLKLALDGSPARVIAQLIDRA